MPDDLDDIFDVLEEPDDRKPQGATRTRADEVLDAVGESQERKPIVCDRCGGARFRVHRPIGGGVAERFCLACRARSPVASVEIASAPTGQEHVGPFYRGSPKPHVSPTEPGFRVRGQARRKED